MLSPEEEWSKEEFRRVVKHFLYTGLTARQEKVIRLRYGIDDGNPMTYEAIGRTMSVTRERIRQIEKKALASLRHPKRLMVMNEFWDNIKGV